ncbi:PIN domain-containing protein [Bosea caraganae]|uniref:Ribonuclease VapC n=1 Tax=Bosea caraganae TaxID=2763117 RepID=A0A370L3L4_9HYPH|nr:type II toxin-antitoxin system VapC family toxin [Bosea caraganae]RDJ22869.1 PIN domain-containing protein [Bosea caraganae]RDJ28648.1 PIN domain-containing protein [Bosea caraganae]
MIALDASAIVAIMVEEPEAAMLSGRLEQRDGQRFASTVTVWEAACAVARRKAISRTAGLALVDEFLAAAAIEPIAPNMTITALAAEAAERYGMGNGPRYPGILNLGDCFSYATAKHLSAALLFKGDDFPRTDIEVA